MSHATTPVFQDLSGAIRRQGDALAVALTAARAGGPTGVVAVHGARVALRRLREALALAAGDLAETDGAGLRHATRRLRDALGAVRTADVARALLTAEAARHAWRVRAVARVRAALDEGADARRRALDRRLARAIRLPHRLARIAAALDGAPARTAIAARVAARVGRRAQQFARALAALGPVYAPESIHRVRVAGKKLRYSLELARDLQHAPVGAELRRIVRTQDALGYLHDLHDLQLTIGLVEADASCDRAIRQALTDMRAAIDVECRVRHAAWLREVPRLVALATRLSHLVAALRRPRARRMASARGDTSARTVRRA